MFIKSSFCFTASFCLSTLVVLGVLTETKIAPAEVFTPPLPPEIVAAEADYEARQLALETGFHRRHLQTLLLSPEERDRRFLAWSEENRAAIEAQAARSEALDALYEHHQIPPLPSPLEELAALAPQGRYWALAYDFARRREALQHDPEQLRREMIAWEEAHGEEFHQLGAARAAETASRPVPRPLPEAVPPPPASAASPLTPFAAPPLPEFAAVSSRLAALQAAHPTPGRRLDAPPVTGAELEAWRTRFLELTSPLEEELQRLLPRQAARDHQQLLEFIHEHTR